MGMACMSIISHVDHICCVFSWQVQKVTGSPGTVSMYRVFKVQGRSSTAPSTALHDFEMDD